MRGNRGEGAAKYEKVIGGRVGNVIQGGERGRWRGHELGGKGIGRRDGGGRTTNDKGAIKCEGEGGAMAKVDMLLT